MRTAPSSDCAHQSSFEQIEHGDVLLADLQTPATPMIDTHGGRVELGSYAAFVMSSAHV